ncbi:MAG TPA: S49 family peptidase, partial [Acetobacteraceae bacterium]|nr:S49 family peptidase [Acetobacteraceae bacterium]
FMLGARALEVGLIDGLGDVESVLREIGGDNARRRDFRPRRRGLLSRMSRMGAAAMVDAVVEAGARRGPQI